MNNIEEIKLNMENLTKEEREQLLKLVEKANDNGKKQKMIDQIKENYKSFYGNKFDKLSKRRIHIYYKCAEDTINNIFTKGYGNIVEIVPSSDFILKNPNYQHKREYIHISPKPVNFMTPDISEQIGKLFRGLGRYARECRVYIYLPLYTDFNDDINKTQWTYIFEENLKYKDGE